jgi:hypothetical protein
MATRLARLEAYLGGLPNGLDSYPEYQTKGSVLREFFEGVPMQSHLGELPPELAELMRHLPPASAWVSEVRSNALHLAAIDLVLGSEEAWERHAYLANRRLLDSALYRIVFRLVGVERVMRQAASQWGLFHRGTTLSAEHYDPAGRRALMVIRTPPRFMPLPIARAYGTALRAALEIAGQKGVRCVASPRDEQRIEITCEWA